MRSATDPFLKTTRAKEHLDDLRERLRRFREDNPITIEREDDLGNQRHILRLKVKDIPEKFPLIVGDFLYCMRSSLDQLVWCLAQTKRPYPRNTQFPILDKPNDHRIKKCTCGVPAAAVAEIKRLQPYTGQNPAAVKAHLLFRLNLLCNIDKHRRIPTDKNVSNIIFPDFPKKSGHLISHDADAGVISVPLFLKSKMRLNPTGQINVIFGDSHEGI